MIVATMASMRWRSRRWDFLIALHGRLTPSDADWDAYCALTRQAPSPEEIRGIVFTLRGGPNARQRARCTELHRRTGISRGAVCCVLSDSTLVRGILSAFTFTGMMQGMYAFPMGHLEEALDYAGVARDEKPRLLEDLLRLGDTVDDVNPVKVALQRARRAA